MIFRNFAVLFLLLSISPWMPAEGRVKLDTSIPYGDIMNMDPKAVDPSGLALTPVESMHSTGAYQYVEFPEWRLTVTGQGVVKPLSLSYEDLGRLPAMKKRVILICSGFFYDYLEWEGIPLTVLLEKAGVADYKKVSFTSVDGYTASFKRREVESHLILVAINSNGTLLPRAHGFPARIVAEDIFGSRWVKYLTEIKIE